MGMGSARSCLILVIITMIIKLVKISLPVSTVMRGGEQLFARRKFHSNKQLRQKVARQLAEKLCGVQVVKESPQDST